MKLYTEKDLNIAMLKYIQGETRQDIINSLTPIELPNKQEIIEKALEVGFTNKLFIDGASWVINKIQGGNNE